MIVVDVETTGFDPKRHAIVSIGAIEFSNPRNQFYGECRIETQTAVEKAALAVNGFTIQDITDTKKPSLSELTRQFNGWVSGIRDKTLGGHNTGFDAGMLKAAFNKASINFPFGYMHVDMHSVVFAHMLRHKGAVPLNRYNFFSIKADGVYEYVGLPPEPKVHHGLTGAKMEAEALSRLIQDKNLLPEYKSYPIPWTIKNPEMFQGF